MSRLKRILILVLIGITIFLVVFYAPLIVSNVLSPLVIAFWLFLRLTFLHVDQKAYWYLIIGIWMIVILYRLIQVLLSTEVEEFVESPEPNSMIKEIHSWVVEINSLDISDSEQSTVQRELTSLLVLHYKTMKSDVTLFNTLMELKYRQIPLPESIYLFLFGDSENNSERSALRRILRFIRSAPRKWTGREKIIARQSVENVLSFIESSLERTDGDKHADTNNY